MQYRAANNKVKRMMKDAKENWIGSCCNEIDNSLARNNSKKAYQIVKDLTKERHVTTSTIKNKGGEALTEEQDIMNRWTEYCNDLHNQPSGGDQSVLKCPNRPIEDPHPILREEVALAIKSLNEGKSPGVNNIPAELVKTGGEYTIDVMTIMCNRIW